MKVSRLLFLLTVFSVNTLYAQPGESSLTSPVISGPKAATIDSFLRDQYQQDKFFGNVLIAEKGKIIYRNSFGPASRETNTSLDAESVFELASVSKQFTAMAIMIAKKKGLLQYEDSLRSFFPELPYQNITVRQLLHHTSGLPDYMELVQEKWDTKKIATNKDMIALFARYKPAVLFAPGEKWEYSNTGYALLASIIEKVSRMSFAEFMRLNIFEPLGMKNTFVYRRRYEPRNIPNYAFGYVTSDGKKFELPDVNAEYSTMVFTLDGIVGDGTVNSTVNDLLKWDQALYTEKLVSKEMLQEAFSSGVTNDQLKTGYGFGWGTMTNEQLGTVLSHTGSWPGYRTLIERYIDKETVVIILQNHEVNNQVAAKIRNTLFLNRKEIVIKETQLPQEMLQSYPGVYKVSSDFMLTVTNEDGKMYVQATGQSKLRIYAEGEDRFVLKVVEARIRFIRDEDGRVTSLVLVQNGRELPATKL